MKKFIYLSIVIATLSLSSFRTQDEIVFSKNIKTNNVLNESIKSIGTKYAAFNSSIPEIGDITKPSRD